MTETAHTPLPWTFEVHELSEGYSAIIYDANGLKVLDHLREEQAAFIVHAVNSHHDLIEALRGARKIIADIDDYMKRPSRGDWGAECACCMGELLDDDRDTIAKIDAALKELGR